MKVFIKMIKNIVVTLASSNRVAFIIHASESVFSPQNCTEKREREIKT